MTDKNIDFRKLKVLQAIVCQGVEVGLCEYEEKYFLWAYHPNENTKILSSKEFKKNIMKKTRNNETREVLVGND